MRHRGWMLSVLATGVVLCAAVVFADHHESKKANTEEGMSPEQMQEMMAKYATPGPEHEYLGYFVGDWTYESKMFMGPEAVQSKGTAKAAWALNGNYLQSTYSGKMMGQPFDGMAIDGFDRVAGKYFNLWFDTMGTGYMLSHGEMSKDGKVLTTKGTMMDPMTGSQLSHRMVTKVKDKNTYTFEMYQAYPDKDEVKAMEVEYTRTGAAASK